MNSEQQYIELYQQCGDSLCQGSHALVNQHRAKALDALVAQGLPTKKCERYKYTDVQAAFAPDYGLNVKRLQMSVNPYEAYKCSIPNLGTNLFYMVNDCIHAKDKLIDTDSLYVGSLVEFAEKYPDRFQTYYNKVAQDGVSALNTLLAQDGAVVWVAAGCKIDSTIQLLNLTVGQVPMMTNRRLLIILEEGAEASVLTCDHTVSKQAHLVTEVAEVYLAEGSHLQCYGIEETADNNTLFSNMHVVQQAGSNLEYASVVLHNGQSRRTLDIHLVGQRAACHASGLVVGGGTQHVDNNLLVSHEAEECTSDVLYKYILDGQSRGAFAGKVYVEKGAQKTDSQETNANLCVSPEAHMFTQPMLEIYADDVKCNHGSTVGQLDDTALFYMAQRGINPDEGRRLLQQAFAWEVIDRIQLSPLKLRLAQMVEERFRLGTSACGDCSLCASK